MRSPIMFRSIFEHPSPLVPLLCVLRDSVNKVFGRGFIEPELIEQIPDRIYPIFDADVRRYPTFVGSEKLLS